MNAPIDLTGQKFGRLLVLEKAKIRQGHTHWRCLCDCGNEIIEYTRKVFKRLSCGCLQTQARMAIKGNEIENRIDYSIVAQQNLAAASQKNYVLKDV